MHDSDFNALLWLLSEEADRVTPWAPIGAKKNEWMKGVLSDDVKMLCLHL